MACRTQIFIGALSMLMPLAGLAQTSSDVKIIEPKKQPTPAKAAKIDTEKFQAGLYVGTLSVEDFNTNLMTGLSFSYQLADNYLVLLNYGTSDVGRSTFERREEVNFLSDDQRTLSYLTLSAGYKLFTARSFLGKNKKYDSDIYLLAGFGEMDYAGEKGNGVSVGASYRVVFTDWMVANVDIKNHIYDARDVFGLSGTKTTQNIEFSIGINALF